MSESPDINGALEAIREILSHPLLLRDGREAFSQMKAIQTGLLTPIEKPSYTVEQLIEQSSKESAVYDALQILCARLLKTGRALPDNLTAWLASHLEGEIKRPKEPTRSHADNAFRNSLILIAVMETCRKYGLTATRSPASSGAIPTACELVSQVLIEMRKPLSPAAVAKIWTMASADIKQWSKSPFPPHKKN